MERFEICPQSNISNSAGCMAVEIKWGNSLIDKALADSWLLGPMRSAGWRNAEGAASTVAEGVGIDRTKATSILESG